MKRKTKDFLKRLGFRVHGLAERFGLHITPVHYYSPLASVRDLRATRGRWNKRSDMSGVPMDVDRQSAALREMCLPYRTEYQDGRALIEGVEKGMGPGYGRIEAMALHGIIRSLKPKRVIEAGSGVSTYCTLAAARLNAADTGHRCSITCIEPYPSEALRAFEGVNLIPKMVQEVPLATFEELGENDVLFIDSSHIARIASDVNYLFLEVLPRLRKGVVVHIHDIYFPYDYQRDALRNFFHSTETALLHAFLAFNTHFETICCLSLLHYDRPDVLKEVFPDYEPRKNDGGLDVEQKPFEPTKGDFPSSIYLRIIN